MRTILPRRGLGLVACVALVGCMDEDGDAAGAVYASWAASPQAYSEMFPIPGVPVPVPGVIDFDEVMRDSQNPLIMQPAFDSGDHLHPNDRGYEAMADAVDPSLFD